MVTMAGSPVFIDTNILVYANVNQMPLHAVAIERLHAMERDAAELWISRQTLREYLAAMTRSKAFEPPIDRRSLLEDVRGFANRLHVAEDGPSVTERLLNLVERIDVGGKQIHDANIVATMQAHGVRALLTHNVSDFARFSGVIDILPLQSA